MPRTASIPVDIQNNYLTGGLMPLDEMGRAAVDLGFSVTVAADACAAAGVSFDGVTVPSPHVHAAFMARLAASHGKVVATRDLLSPMPPMPRHFAQETG